MEDEDNFIWLQALNLTPYIFRNSSLIADLSGCKAKLVAFENAWNEDDHSPNIYLLDNKLTLCRKSVSLSTDGARGKCGYIRGQHYWTVIWHGPKFGTSAVVGIATRHQELHKKGYCTLIGSTVDSWGWDISKRVLEYNGNAFAKFPEKDVIVSQLKKK